MSAFKKGDRVKHPEYGEGVVRFTDPYAAAVEFDEARKGFHSAAGNCKPGFGWWVKANEASLIAPAKYAQLKVDANLAPDNTNPDHYKRGGTETIDYLRAKMSEEEFKGFCRGNALKYISRAPDKNGDEDYRKAIWYLRVLVGDDPRKV